MDQICPILCDNWETELHTNPLRFQILFGIAMNFKISIENFSFFQEWATNRVIFSDCNGVWLESLKWRISSNCRLKKSSLSTFAFSYVEITYLQPLSKGLNDCLRPLRALQGSSAALRGLDSIILINELIMSTAASVLIKGRPGILHPIARSLEWNFFSKVVVKD